MRRLNHIRIAPDGKTAMLGGGVKGKEVTDALWAAGKLTGEVILRPMDFNNGRYVTYPWQSPALATASVC